MSGTRGLGHLQPQQAAGPGPRLGARLARLPAAQSHPRAKHRAGPQPQRSHHRPARASHPSWRRGWDPRGHEEAADVSPCTPAVSGLAAHQLPGGRGGASPPSWTQGQSHGERQGSKGASRKEGASPAHASHRRDTAPGHHSPRQRCAAWAGPHVAGPMGLLWGRHGAPTPHAGGERGRPRRAHRGWEPGCPPAGAEALDAGGAVQAGGWTPPRPLPTRGGPSPGTDADSPETTPRPRR